MRLEVSFPLLLASIPSFFLFLLSPCFFLPSLASFSSSSPCFFLLLLSPCFFLFFFPFLLQPALLPLPFGLPFCPLMAPCSGIALLGELDGLHDDWPINLVYPVGVCGEHPPALYENPPGCCC